MSISRQRLNADGRVTRQRELPQSSEAATHDFLEHHGDLSRIGTNFFEFDGKNAHSGWTSQQKLVTEIDAISLYDTES